MNRSFFFVTLVLLAPAAPAQDSDLAAERARLANQRIEAEARIREEQERQAKLAAEREQGAVPQRAAPPPAVDTQNAVRETSESPVQAAPVSAPPREAAKSTGDVDRMLEQVRTLGELRDAGYITEAEFERIKKRILDGAL